MSSPVSFLRRIAIAEGISYLLLLFIAMPLKYFAGWPQSVLVAGWIHGALFVVFCGALARVWLGCGWPVPRCAVVFIAGLIPFGAFLIDRRPGMWDEKA